LLKGAAKSNVDPATSGSSPQTGVNSEAEPWAS